MRDLRQLIDFEKQLSIAGLEDFSDIDPVRVARDFTLEQELPVQFFTLRQLLYFFD
jgi:hypothetical protein